MSSADNWKAALNGWIFIAGALALAGLSSPLWFSHWLERRCWTEHLLTEYMCQNAARGSQVAVTCADCTLSSLTGWAPFVGGLIAAAVGIGAFIGNLQQSGI